MDRERIKLDKKVSNKKDLLKIIEEKEIEIENQKIKLQLANEEIEKIKLELKELKKDISYSIIDRTDNELEEKRSNSFIGITEKEKNNISIEIVEVDEDKPIDEDDFLEGYINKIIDEVTNYSLIIIIIFLYISLMEYIIILLALYLMIAVFLNILI